MLAALLGVGYEYAYQISELQWLRPSVGKIRKEKERKDRTR